MVLRSLVETFRRREWRLMVAHVRANHVHVVVDAPDQKRWARRGSTRYLWDREQISAAITYVLDKQGERMATFDCEVEDSPNGLIEHGVEIGEAHRGEAVRVVVDQYVSP